MKYVGIDISKDKIDVHLRPDNISFVIKNNKDDIDKLTKQLKELNVEIVVMESTGGLEMPLLISLFDAGVNVASVNPRKTRAFALALGYLEKTDKIDSQVIAHFAEALKPCCQVIPDAQTREMNALMVRRRQMMEMLIAEKNRLSSTLDSVITRLEEHILWLENELTAIDSALSLHISSRTEFIKKEKLLTAVKGVGKVLSKALLSGLPELGILSNKKISKLVGLAPINKDSGKFKGKRMICGGREDIRTALYMPTLSAIRWNKAIKEFYQRLIASGKPKKVAIVACMHKLLVILNSIIRTGKNWDKDFKENSSKLPSQPITMVCHVV
jgi:transposase